jgi:DNA-binding TFAR19-related protein (PDSD5 family)
VSEEDNEIKIIKARKFAELARRMQEQTKVPKETTPKEKTSREILIEQLSDRGDEVLIKAEQIYPQEMEVVEEKLAELIKSGEINQKIKGGQLLQLLKLLGLNVPIETKFEFYEDGEFISFQDKVKKSIDKD